MHPWSGSVRSSWSIALLYWRSLKSSIPILETQSTTSFCLRLGEWLSWRRFQLSLELSCTSWAVFLSAATLRGKAAKIRTVIECRASRSHFGQVSPDPIATPSFLRRSNPNCSRFRAIRRVSTLVQSRYLEATFAQIRLITEFTKWITWNLAEGTR